MRPPNGFGGSGWLGSLKRLHQLFIFPPLDLEQSEGAQILGAGWGMSHGTVTGRGGRGCGVQKTAELEEFSCLQSEGLGPQLNAGCRSQLEV